MKTVIINNASDWDALIDEHGYIKLKPNTTYISTYTGPAIIYTGTDPLFSGPVTKKRKRQPYYRRNRW